MKRGLEQTAAADAAGPPLSPLPGESALQPRAQALLLVIIAALYLAFASVHAVRAPLGATGYQDAPDEEAHVTVVRVVALGRLPTRERPGVSPGDVAPSYEWHQPPLYYLIAARFIPFGVRAVRLVSVTIGLLCILAIYFAGRLLIPARPDISIIAAGFAALVPGHIAILSVVNNDALLELLFSLEILLLIVALSAGLTGRRSCALGIVFGAALLTKVTAILLAPVIGIALLLAWRNGERPRNVAASALCILVIAAIVSGWWFLRNAALYRELLPLTAFGQSFLGTAKAADVVGGKLGLRVEGWDGYAGLVGQWTFQSFFAVYSTPRGAQWGVPAFLPAQLYTIAAAACVAACAGAATAVRTRGQFSAAQIACAIVMASATAVVGGAFVAFTTRYFQAQGRYFYPVMLPISLMLAFGWSQAFPQRYANVASLVLLVFLGAFCVAFLQTAG